MIVIICAKSFEFIVSHTPLSKGTYRCYSRQHEMITEAGGPRTEKGDGIDKGGLPLKHTPRDLSKAFYEMYISEWL